MSQLPNCPKCQSEYTYEDRHLFVCPGCAHEWPIIDDTKTSTNEQQLDIVRDAHGNELKDGDSIIIVKDLRIKGSSAVLKQGTRVKNIRLIDGDHNIDCKIDGFGAMQLKSEFVKKG